MGLTVQGDIITQESNLAKNCQCELLLCKNLTHTHDYSKKMCLAIFDFYFDDFATIYLKELILFPPVHCASVLLYTMTSLDADLSL